MKEKKGPSRIEIAKTLRQIKALTNEEEYAKIAAIIKEAYPASTDDAVVGLSQEDEFLLLCVMMGTVTHIAPLEQRPAIVTATIAPDLLARFQPPYIDHAGKWINSSHHSGYKCFVEVKSTAKSKLNIGGQHLRRLRQFAGAFGLPLIFAVRFTSFSQAAAWSIVEDTGKNSISIGLEAIFSPLRSVLWCDHGYLLFPSTCLRYSYDLNSSAQGINHEKYGKLVEMQIITRETEYVVSRRDMNLILLFFEAYGLEEVKKETVGPTTHVIYRSINKMLTTSDLIFGINRLPRNDQGNLIYDAARIIRQLADGQTPSLITRQLVELVARKMCKINAVGLMALGAEKRDYDTWIRTGGKPPDA